MAIPADVAAFLEGPARAISFPREALTDAQASADYLSLMRTPRPPVDNSTRCPVDRMTELAISDAVTVRIYRPAGEGPFPTLVYFHGGGWVTGNLDMHDLTCRMIAVNAGFVVVNVDYRLAPEQRFPIPLDDCYDATAWVSEHIAEYGGDPHRLVLGGSSAGANLAIAVAIRARDEGGPEIAYEVLICPVVDSRRDSDSYDRNGEGYYVDRWVMEWFWSLYLADAAQATDPLASPAHVGSLEGMPAALVVVAELDPLADEGIEYARRLTAAGAASDLVIYPGQIHGFAGLIGVLADAEVAVLDISRHLAERFPPAGPTDSKE